MPRAITRADLIDDSVAVVHVNAGWLDRRRDETVARVQFDDIGSGMSTDVELSFDYAKREVTMTVYSPGGPDKASTRTVKLRERNMFVRGR